MLNYKEEPLFKEHEILYFGKNLSGKDFVVGDIHGQFHKLDALLYETGFNKNKDRLFSAGDLVDRGKHSTDCVEWLEKDWFFPVMGNHDEFVLWSYYNLPGFDNNRWASEMNGGSWWFSLSKKQQDSIASCLRHLPHAIEIQKERKIGIVHADVPDNADSDWEIFKDHIFNRDSKTMHDCKVNRAKARYEKNPIVNNVDDVYFGHCAFPDVVHKGNCHFIDTGASYEGYPIQSDYYRKWGHLTLVVI